MQPAGSHELPQPECGKLYRFWRQRGQLCGVQIEHGLDQRVVSPFSDQTVGRSFPSEEFQSLCEQGLAGSGLTGEAREARCELHGGILDEDEVPDAQRDEHGSGSDEAFSELLIEAALGEEGELSHIGERVDLEARVRLE